MSTDVSVTIGTMRFVGWTFVNIRRSIENLSNTFQLGVLDVWYPSLEYGIKPGDACTVKIGNETVITGFIDNLSAEIAGSEYLLQIEGRCKCCDLIDCSAMNTPGSWKKISIFKLANELVKPFNITVVNEKEDLGEDVKNFTLDSGQSPFEALRPACEKRAILLISDTEARLLLTQSGNQRAHDSIVYGRNVVKAEAKYSNIERFSQYTVKGSSSSDGEGWGKSNTKVKGSATDPTILRFRPKILLSDGAVTNNLAKIKAAWEAQVRAARSAEIVVSVSGWRQSNNALWKENQLVIVDLPPLRIKQTELLIAQVSYVYNNTEGELVELLLRRPDAYSANPTPKVKKKEKTGAAGWE